MSKRQELLDFIARAGLDGTELVDAALQEAVDYRAHIEAMKLRNEAKLYAHEAVDTTGREAESNLRTSRELIYAASLIDPYEERDGHLVRKSDGTTAYL